MGWTTKKFGFDFWQEEEIFLSFLLNVQTASGPHNILPSGYQAKEKWPRRETNRSSLSNSEVKNA
jgi:hypothetical protein